MPEDGASEATVPGLPTDSGRYDPPSLVREWDAECPVRPLTLAGGHPGWLVTGYQEMREVLADPRFGVDRKRINTPIREFPDELRDFSQPGNLTAYDPPEHTRYRRLLIGEFSARRMRKLTERIEGFASELLDAMEAAGPPVDLVEMYALPIPSLVICDLLGVPYEDRAEFQTRAHDLLRLTTSPEELLRLKKGLVEYMTELVRSKREHPTDDIISGLIAKDDTLTDEELKNIGATLLGAGHETTANFLGLSVLALFEHPEQLRALREDPELMPGAVEEMLRYLAVLRDGTLRVANEDVEIGGRTIRADESVVLHLPQGNRDPRLHDAPDRFDVRRKDASHLTFGHGIHSCLGRELTRIEMIVALKLLLARFPGLRLAVPSEEVPMRVDMGVYGVHGLPVTW